MKIALLILAATPGAFAATIYQSGSPAVEELPYDGLKSDSKPHTVFSQTYPQQTAASRFVLNTADTIQAITFEGFYFPYGVPPLTDEFQIAFFENGGGIPGERIGSILGASHLTRAFTGQSIAEGSIYRFELDLDQAVALEAGTYWIALIHTSTYEDAAFNWSYMDRSDPAAFSQSGIEGTYYATNFTLVYTLENARFVPEPSSALLTLPSLILVARRRRK